MKFDKQNIEQLLIEAVSRLKKEHDWLTLVTEDLALNLTEPKTASHGDLASNILLQVFSGLTSDERKQIGSPVALGEMVMQQLNKKELSQNGIAKIEVVMPGFMNFVLVDEVYEANLQALISNQAQSYENLGKDSSMIVEYSSPNIAKPFTIGHLRSTVIGDSIANLLERTGFHVYRDNHLGDWGTQFGKQIVAIEKWGNIKKIKESKAPIKELVALYVRFHEEAERYPELNEEAREVFKKLEQGDEKMVKYWQECVDVSLKEFNKIYEKLDVHFTENHGLGYGEAYMMRFVPQVIEELKKKNLLVKSQGAQVVYLDEYKLPPLIVIKKDDASIYATRDLATDWYRKENYPSPLTIINEIGMEQSLYMKQIYAVEEKLGWFKLGQRVHVAHGLYRFKDRKMSTRKGEVIWLDDILDEAITRVRKVSKTEISDEEVEKIAISAIKWNDLSREAKRDIEFSFDDILNIKGNSGPYMQYTLVRILAILDKKLVQKDLTVAEILNELAIRYQGDQIDGNYVHNALERELLKKLSGFYEAVSKAATQYAPHLVCNYLYELAAIFNTFYAQCTVRGNKHRELLTLGAGLIIYQGLKLLGIKAVVKM